MDLPSHLPIFACMFYQLDVIDSSDIILSATADGSLSPFAFTFSVWYHLQTVTFNYQNEAESKGEKVRNLCEFNTFIKSERKQKSGGEKPKET